MKSIYGKGCHIPKFRQIFPAEAMVGEDRNDYAVYCAMLTASKIMTIEELNRVADWVHHWNQEINHQVAETCKRIVRENLGYIWLYSM